jgi:hypothetical protein
MSKKKWLKYSPTFKRDLAGIYYLLQDGRLVYVGHSGNIWRRIGVHIDEGRILFDEWFYQEMPNVADRVAVEARLINNFNPRHNRTGRTGRPDRAGSSVRPEEE